MYPDAEPHEVGDEDEPAIGTYILTTLLPLEHQPEDHCRKERAEGIHLRLYGTEPEGVRERIDQAPDKPRG